MKLYYYLQKKNQFFLWQSKHVAIQYKATCYITTHLLWNNAFDPSSTCVLTKQVTVLCNLSDYLLNWKPNKKINLNFYTFLFYLIKRAKQSSWLWKTLKCNFTVNFEKLSEIKRGVGSDILWFLFRIILNTTIKLKITANILKRNVLF